MPLLPAALGFGSQAGHTGPPELGPTPAKQHISGWSAVYSIFGPWCQFEGIQGADRTDSDFDKYSVEADPGKRFEVFRMIMNKQV